MVHDRAQEMQGLDLRVLEFRCLGTFAFLGSTGWREGPARARGRSFLEYLASHARAAIARSVLIDALWPDLESDECAHRLHLAASGARMALREASSGPNPILYRDDSYCWHRTVRVVADTDRFSACYADGSVAAMTEGVRMYAGQFLAGESGEWLLPIRTRYEHMYVTMLERLAQDAARRKDYAGGTDLALKAVAADPAHEGATRLAMLCLAKSGRRAVALAEYDSLERYLQRWLSVKPMTETATLRDRIRQDDVPDAIV